MDRNPGLRNDLRIALESLGIHVMKSTGKGKLGYEEIANDSKGCNLVITELALEDITAVQFMSALRKNSRFSKTHVIVLLNEDTLESLEPALPLGLSGFLFKPVQMDKFPNILANLFGTYEYYGARDMSLYTLAAAKFYELRNDYESAINYLTELRKIGAHGRVSFDLGRMYHFSKNFDASGQCLTEALRIDPTLKDEIQKFRKANPIVQEQSIVSIPQQAINLLGLPPFKMDSFYGADRIKSAVVASIPFDIRTSIRNMLASFGVQRVETTPNGADVPKIAKDKQCDLIIADLKLEDMNALQLIDVVRKAPLQKTLKILLLVDPDSIANLEKAFGIGADGYALKPLSAEMIRRGLHNMMVQGDITVLSGAAALFARAAYYHFELKKHAIALSFAKVAVERVPKDPVSLMYLGLLTHRDGDRPAAKKLYKEATDLNGDLEPACQRLSTLVEKQLEQEEEAKEAAKRAEELAKTRLKEQQAAEERDRQEAAKRAEAKKGPVFEVDDGPGEEFVMFGVTEKAEAVVTQKPAKEKNKYTLTAKAPVKVTDDLFKVDDAPVVAVFGKKDKQENDEEIKVEIDSSLELAAAQSEPAESAERVESPRPPVQMVSEPVTKKEELPKVEIKRTATPPKKKPEPIIESKQEKFPNELLSWGNYVPDGGAPIQNQGVAQVPRAASKPEAPKMVPPKTSNNAAAAKKPVAQQTTVQSLATLTRLGPPKISEWIPPKILSALPVPEKTKFQSEAKKDKKVSVVEWRDELGEFKPTVLHLISQAKLFKNRILVRKPNEVPLKAEKEYLESVGKIMYQAESQGRVIIKEDKVKGLLAEVIGKMPGGAPGPNNDGYDKLGRVYLENGYVDQFFSKISSFWSADAPAAKAGPSSVEEVKTDARQVFFDLREPIVKLHAQYWDGREKCGQIIPEAVKSLQEGKTEEGLKLIDEAFEADFKSLEAFRKIFFTVKKGGYSRESNDFLLKASKTYAHDATIKKELEVIVKKVEGRGETPESAKAHPVAQKPKMDLSKEPPRTIEQFRKKAIELLKWNRFEETVELCTKMAEIFPRHPEVYNLLGVCYKKQNKHAEAITYYKKGIAADPTSVKLHHNLALAYAALGDMKSASQVLQKSKVLEAAQANSTAGKPKKSAS